MKVLVTGSAGFVAGYLVEELLDKGHEVYGIDNFSKYGKVVKSYDSHPRYHFVEGDAKNIGLLKELMEDCAQVVAAASMIGGVSFFQARSYDLLAENERITAATFDAAIWAFKNRKLGRITVVSSSTVFDSTCRFPTPEGEQLRCPPPSSSYGFQKLAAEYFAKGAFEQYGLPYSIIRPVNVVGIGEKKAKDEKDVISGNVKLALSHVVPDLVRKVLRGQDPVHIFGNGQQTRQYTYGGDIARGIRLCLESDKAVNEDFHLGTPVETTVLELADLIWNKIQPEKPFRYLCDEPFQYDLQKRMLCTKKASERLGFEANTTLPEVLDEVIPWMREQMRVGNF